MKNHFPDATKMVCRHCGNGVTKIYVNWFGIAQTFYRHIGNGSTKPCCGKKPNENDVMFISSTSSEEAKMNMANIER